jgi:hypothetical protein
MKDTIGLINMQVDNPLKELNEDRPSGGHAFCRQVPVDGLCACPAW